MRSNGTPQYPDMDNVLPDLVCRIALGDLSFRSGSNALGKPVFSYCNRRDQFLRPVQPVETPRLKKRDAAKPGAGF